MNHLSIDDVSKYVENNIERFHNNRLKSLEIVDISKILKRKNPYLYKVKNYGIANDIVKEILDAHISSSEETKFGDWLEEMAIFINNKVFGGTKSSATGIDLEFVNDDVRYLVAIKSGPNWGNSSQIKKMISDFSAARRTLLTSNFRITIQAINGCCYGSCKDNLKTGDYYKYCGQKFWEFISAEPNLYLDIIKPLGTKAKEKNEKYQKAYDAILNKLTMQFIKEYCDSKGKIDWEKIVKFTSAK
jgi:hypothetical protein